MEILSNIACWFVVAFPFIVIGSGIYVYKMDEKDAKKEETEGSFYFKNEGW